VQFVPVVGESLKRPNARIFASHHVADLHRIVNGEGAGEALSFSAVACYIPVEFDAIAEEATIRKIFALDAGYREDFGRDNKDSDDRDLLINKLDCLITSLGTASRDVQDPYLVDTVEMLQISREELLEYSYGNISGYILPKDTAEARRRIGPINGRWTGITIDHISHIAQNSKNVGVIVLAIGSAKAPIVIVPPPEEDCSGREECR
jgi:hypothetical protein